MAEEGEGTTEIAASPVEVLAVITDFAAYPKWASGVKKAEVRKKDSKGRPNEVFFDVGQMGIGATYTLAYRYKAKDGGLSWKSTEATGAVKKIEGEYLLEPSGNKTKVTYRLKLEPAINLGGFMKRQAERTIVNAALGGLKKQVESGESP
jgi:ribosome-associated toxin RatA of RatAB toxin-antitoxin module